MSNNILHQCKPKIVQPSSTDVAQLGLEIIDGPYRGVTFGFTHFDVKDQADPSGLRPVKFETTIYSAPEGFEPSEPFDAFCGEVLMAWLQLIAAQNPNDNPQG